MPTTTPTPGLGRAWKAIRLVILNRDRHLCQLKLPGCKTKATCVDHIIPRSEGGDLLDPANLRASCDPCNTSRSASRRALLAQAMIDSARNQHPATPSRDW